MSTLYREVPSEVLEIPSCSFHPRVEGWSVRRATLNTSSFLKHQGWFRADNDITRVKHCRLSPFVQTARIGWWGVLLTRLAHTTNI